MRMLASEPQKKARKVQTRRTHFRAAKSSTTLAVVRTTGRASRLLVVTPYFRQCALPGIHGDIARDEFTNQLVRRVGHRSQTAQVRR